MAEQRVASAVASLILDQDRILLGKRFEAQQFAGWQCPGGYLGMGESFEEAARRHALQKAGIYLSSVTTGPVTNNIFNTEPLLHTVTQYVICRDFKVQFPNRLSDATCEWQWFNLAQIPGERFLPLDILLKHHDISQL